MWSSPTRALASLLLALTVSASSPSLDCSTRKDGFFAIGCSSEFFGCSGGQAFLMNCSSDLVYDETRQLCEYPGNVVACGGVAPAEGSGSNEGSGSEGSGSEEGSGDGVEGSGTEGSGEGISGMCKERVDGFYRLAACGKHFLGCSGGVAWRMSCPASLKYDEEKKICDYPGNVDGCEEGSGEEGSGEGSGTEGSGIEEGSGTEGSGIEEGSGTEGSGTEEGSGEGSGTEGSGEGDISEMCKERVDGFYRLAACGEHFLGCSGEVAWKMSCPASLKYDEGTQMCDYPGNVKGCDEGDKMDDSNEEVMTTDDESTSEEISNDTVKEDVAIEEENQFEKEDIIVTKDGKIAEEVEEVKEMETKDDIIDEKKEDVVEEEKEMKEMEAEDDIIDDRKGDAVEDKMIEKEVDVEDVVNESESSESTASSTTSAEYDDVNETPTCSGRADGFYALGCSSDMLACTNGIAHIMPCPAGLVFDERNQICDFPVHVAACSSRDQLLTDDDLLTVDGVSPSHPDIPRARDSELVAATVMPVTVPTVEYMKEEYGVERGPRKNRRDARCKSSDGLFSLDCSIEFVACRDGVATKLECGEGETFDENAQSCVPLARHPTCFSHALQADDVIDSDVQMVKDADDEADLQKPIDHSFPCSFEGARAESPCADWFKLCEGGRGIEMFCLQGHLFDQETARCVPAGQLAHCQAQ